MEFLIEQVDNCFLAVADDVITRRKKKAKSQSAQTQGALSPPAEGVRLDHEQMSSITAQGPNDAEGRSRFRCPCVIL